VTDSGSSIVGELKPDHAGKGGMLRQGSSARRPLAATPACCSFGESEHLLRGIGCDSWRPRALVLLWAIARRGPA